MLEIIFGWTATQRGESSVVVLSGTAYTQIYYFSEFQAFKIHVVPSPRVLWSLCLKPNCCFSQENYMYCWSGQVILASLNSLRVAILPTAPWPSAFNCSWVAQTLAVIMLHHHAVKSCWFLHVKLLCRTESQARVCLFISFSRSKHTCNHMHIYWEAEFYWVNGI